MGCRLADECYVVFYSKTYLWSFSPNNCGFILGKVLDFGTGVTVFALIIIFDLITICRIKQIMAMRRKLRRRELKFFAQSCFQFGLFVIKLTNFYFISEYFTSDPVTYRWPLFFTTTFAWECTHCVDGYA
uniref:7TM_GPCR_Srx domain-containing protein n=1 Tax=Angiostrongylus cantonensis TaxID=6313 RepID=A0A0K0D6Y3_ANGCA